MTTTDIKLPNCVLMDIDNTLYEYAPCHEAGLQQARSTAEELLNINNKDFNECFKQARSQVKNRLKSSASSHSRLLYFQRLLELAGLGSQPEYAIKLEQSYWQTFLFESELFPEVEDFMDDLRIRGIPLVFITDLTAYIQMRKFEYWGLSRFSDHIVTSEESGLDKPDAAIFELALAKLGGVEGVIWMIGDSYEKDIVGAKNALSATTLYKTPKSHQDYSSVDKTFSHYSELREILKRALE